MRQLLGIVLVIGVIAAMSARAAERRAPNFSSDVIWLDREAPVPHKLEGYRGRVVLVDFWEYTCINCIRDFAVVKRWYRKYHPYGFEVIGVHFGEFRMGFSPANVERAAKRYRLPWPVVADVHGETWRAFGSDAWPNRYLIDPEGNIVMQIKGEGNDRAMEEKLHELLAAAHPEVKSIALDASERTFDPNCGYTTQETYVGNWYGHGALQNREGYRDDMDTNFKNDRLPEDGGVVLGGWWETAHDGVTSKANNGTAILRYHARSVYGVLSTKKSVRVHVLQDGKPLPAAEAGADVAFDGNGSYVEVDVPRMYDLVKNARFGSHLLQLQPDGPGLTLHSFTYGNDCQQNFAQQ